MEQCQADASSWSVATRALASRSLVARPIEARPILARMPDETLARAPGRVIERLPFTIRRVQNDDDMRKAVRVRYAAYARHVPEFARTLVEPEAADYADDTIVLLAESKLDGSALGSTRIRTNLLGPLDMEASLILPDWLQGRRLVEASRLGVGYGRESRLVKLALIKACFAYCEDNDIDYSVATARAGVDRQYEQLTFIDVFPDRAPIPLHHVGNIPHRVMAFDIESFEVRWQAARHPLLDFFFHTLHPDIDIHRGAEALRMPVPREGICIGQQAARRGLAAS